MTQKSIWLKNEENIEKCLVMGSCSMMDDFTPLPFTG
jgi:hypothetical protein